MQVLDASGKPPSAILEATMMDMGSFDECLKIRFNDSSISFSGQYCMVGYSSPMISTFPPNGSLNKEYVDSYGTPPEWVAKEMGRAGGFLKSIAFWLGTCIPSTCSQEDLTKLLTQITKPLSLKVSIADCQIQEPKHWRQSAFVAVCILTVIAGFCIVGTAVDIITAHQNLDDHVAVRVLKAFSIHSNVEKFLSYVPDGNNLGCFHGMRFLSVNWIILGHTYVFVDTWRFMKFRNLINLVEIFNNSLATAAIDNAFLAVTTFYFISGFLLFYYIWRKLEKSDGKMSLFKFLVYKYWRLTPCLGLVLLLFLVLPLIDDGPLWDSTFNPEVRRCEKYWWTNVLYINNWWPSYDLCIGPTWFLATLMQLHFVGFVVLLIFYRWRILGTYVGLTVLLGCSVLTSSIAWWNNYPMPAIRNSKDEDLSFDLATKVYLKPYVHVATYFIGMVTAYSVSSYRDKNLPAA